MKENKFLNTERKSIDLSIMRDENFYNENKHLSDLHVKYVKQGEGFIEKDACPLCDSIEFEYFTIKSGIEYLICNDCSMLFPKYFPQNPSDVYGGEKYIDEFSKVDEGIEDYKKQRFGIERIQILKNYFISLDGIKILDVGCGTGWFLSLCKNYNMECYGQEIGKELSLNTQKRIGVKVFNCNINDIDGFDDFFNVVVMFDLIEHVVNPVMLINDVKQKLVSGGIILIFTPNNKSFGIENLKEHSSLLIPTDHLCIFNDKSVEIIAEKTELDLLEISFNGIDIGDYLSYLEIEGFKISGETKQKIYDDLQPVLDEKKFSNHMRFILKKN